MRSLAPIFSWTLVSEVYWHGAEAQRRSLWALREAQEQRRPSQQGLGPTEEIDPRGSQLRSGEVDHQATAGQRWRSVLYEDVREQIPQRAEYVGKQITSRLA